MAYTQKQYTESDAVKKFRENMEAHEGMKPADYVSQYQPQIKSTLDSILNRKDFQYDVNGDALYQQYKDRFVNLGQQAMMDTMGQASKLTGGYGNSNAQMVGQQAYQGYLQGLTDKIPELAQLAYQRYAQQGQDLYQKYGLLNTQEQADYDRWNTTYNQWMAERNRLADLYNTERGFDYGQYRDAVGDDQWKAQYDENARQWQAQFDEDLRRFNFANQLGEFAPVEAPAAVGGGYYDDGSRSTTGNPSPKGKTVEEVYMENKKAGASASELNAYLKASISEGRISQKDATELRNKRY